MNFEYFFNAWNHFLKEDQTAVVLSDTFGAEMTRANVEEISGRVCAWLKYNGISTGDFVLINLERSVKPVLAIMGVWKAGAAFTLVESNYARDRIEFIREDWQPKIEINEQVWSEILEMESDHKFIIANDHDVCFSVYTSGTTGTPKGVLHEYGQIKMEMISEMRNDGTWRENTKTRWGLVAPLNFVASLKIVVHFLYCGGHLYILGYDTVKDPRKLSKFFLKNRINETFLSPSLLRLKEGNFGPFMKYIYTGAEPANNISIKGVELNNTYTMSESFFTVSEFIIDKPYPVCPIGLPRFNLSIKLINEDGEDVNPGEVGEFCFQNPYCRGYINNDIENSKHFINGYFHTGDLAVFKNGQYVLKGRRDDMIKIDGNRIEPSEIEAVCRDLLTLSHCVAKGFEEEALVALYYTNAYPIDEEDAREKIAKVLPYYMVPSFFVRMDRLPINASGKLDRKVLTLPVQYYKAEYVAPRDSFEEKLIFAAEKVLEINHIGMLDDFFKLGGNSIKAMALLDKLDEDELLTPTILFKGRTFEKISNLYREAKAEAMSTEEKEKLGRSSPMPLSPSLKWYWEDMNNGAIDFYQEYRFSFFVPAGFIAQGINRYISHNSTFNMILEQGEDGMPVQRYSEKTPFVEVEYKSEDEVYQIEKSFVRPFEYGEPLIRIRVIRTTFHTYLFFHAFHMVVDGAGMHLLIEDLIHSIKNKPIKKIQYFAWAWEENRWSSPDNIEKHLPYFKDKYFEAGYDICIKKDQKTGEHGIAETFPAKVSLEKVKAYCSRYNISINSFLIAAVLLTQSAYNHSERNMTIWNYNNRGPKDNHAGNLYRSAYIAINRSQINSLKKLYQSIDFQNQESLWRLHDYEYFFEFERASKEPSLTITYLEDWFSDDQFPGFLGIPKKLPNYQKTSENSELIYVLSCTHEKGCLCASLQYGKSYNTSKSANKFIQMLEFAMNEIICDRLPDFTEN